MTYATETALAAQPYGLEIAELLDRDGDGAPDDGVLAQAQTAADALVDAYLASAYTLPLSATPPLVTQLACDIARFHLWGANPPAEVRKRYEEAVARLKEIASGVITLTASGVGITPSGAALSAGYEERERTFSDTTLAGFVGA